MQAICTTNSGLEKISYKEISEYISTKNLELLNSIIKFDVNSYDDLAKICYYCQSISRVVLLLDQFKISNNFETTIDIISKRICNIELSKYIFNGSKFKTVCKRNGTHSFRSVDLMKEVTKVIIANNSKFTLIPVFKNENLIFYVYIVDKICYFGIDFSGVDLSKRDYKIFSHRESLNANVAFSMLKYSGYKPTMKIIDPFCGSGMIPIEAAMIISKKPVNNHKNFVFKNYSFYKNKFVPIIKKMELKDTKVYASDNQFRHIRNAKKNASIAGVKKKIEFMKLNVKDLHSVFPIDFFDRIITDPPAISKRKNSIDLHNLYKEFLNQSDIVLKKDGKIVLINKPNKILDKAITNSVFKIENKYQVYQGKEEKIIMLLVKKNGIM